MASSHSKHPSLLQTYQERASLPNTSPLAAYLFKLIAAKKSNLCVSADVSSTRELLQLAEEVGDEICLLKTHADIITDFGGKTIHDLQEIARRKGFLIFEDRKFGDIGNTVQLQYTAGPLQIVRWANIVNAHIFPGPAIVSALAKAANDAVAAYNSSVETQISGPPVIPQDPDEIDVPEEPLVGASEGTVTTETDRDRYSSDDDDDDDDDDEVVRGGEPSTYPEEDHLANLIHTSGRRASSPRAGERKFSVVSVSTTISTRTEHISPQPTPLHHYATGLGQIQGEEANIRRALHNLGEPPMVRALLLLAQMSSAGNLMDEAYAAKCTELARQQPDFVIGYIAQRSLNTQPGDNFITMTPGVQIGGKGDAFGQQYNTPEKVVTEAGTDIIIVGRGIYGAADRKTAAAEYRRRAWKAYQERIGLSTQ